MRNTIPQNQRNLGKVTIPTSDGTVRKNSLLKSGEFKARNTTLPMKYPAVWPTELQVDA